ncbi:MAG TPA: hypothetical protein VGD58_02410, partial [Herpetosiphonaceae bacterium]
FRGITVPADDPLKREALQIEVTDPEAGSTWLAHTPYYTFEKSGQQVTHPDIQSGWWSDLYLAPSQYLPAKQASPGVLQMLREQPQQIAGYTLIFQKFELPNREGMLRGEGPLIAQAVLTVIAPDGTTTTVTPAMEVTANQPVVSTPITLPSGINVALTGVDPATGLAVIKVGGVDLSAANPEDFKARAFVEVSVEPGIKLVWAGIIVSVLGGVLALIRRWREARPRGIAETPLPVPLPQHGRPARPAGVATAISPSSEVRS